MTGLKTTVQLWGGNKLWFNTLENLQKDCSNAKLSLPISEIEQI